MKAITLPAHFDGEHIRLDEPYPLEPDTPLLVTVLPNSLAADDPEPWWGVAVHGVAAAYGPNEPEYTLERLKERNPDYARS